MNYNLINIEDAAWTAAQPLSQSDPVLRRVWVALMDRYTMYREPAFWEPIFVACRHRDRVPELDPLYEARFAPRDVHGPEADVARERLRKAEEHRARARGRNRRTEHAIPVEEQVEAALSDATIGPDERWPHVLELLDLDPDDARRSHAHALNLSVPASPILTRLSDDIRLRVLEEAARYLRAADLDPDRLTAFRASTKGCGSTMSICSKTLAALNAAVLLGRHGTLTVDELSDATLVRLAVGLIAFRVSYGEETRVVASQLRDEAYQRAPQLFRDTISKVARGIDRPSTLVSRLQPVWDDELRGLFVGVLRVLESDHMDRDDLMDVLIEVGTGEAIEILLSAITPLASRASRPKTPAEPTSEDEEAGLRWQSTKAFAYAPERTWDVIGKRFEADDDFARQWLQRMASRAYRRHEWPQAPAALTGAIYRRLHELIPPSHDPTRLSGVGYSGSPNEVARLRSLILGSLLSRAEPTDIAELRRLQANLNDLDLRWEIARAEEQYRTLNAAYPGPSEILNLAADPQRLPIRSDYELQQAVLLALDNVQRAISEQEQPEASDFWEKGDRPKNEGLTPKDELSISNKLVRMLRPELARRGLSITREAEVARWNKTDIRIEAPPNAAEGRSDAAVVIIEVKCCWSSDVPASLMSQLVERYLRVAGRRHGIYLVVDFVQDHWSETIPSGKPDMRLQDARRMADQLSELLESSAKEAREAGYEVVPRILRIPAAW